MDQVSQRGIQAGGAHRESHSVARCDTSRRMRDATRRTAPGVKAA